MAEWTMVVPTRGSALTGGATSQDMATVVAHIAMLAYGARHGGE